MALPLQKPLILASTSASRQSLLKAAGLHFTAMASGLDEGMLKASSKAAGWSPEKLALELACAKAEIVARAYPEALTIGGDQILVCDGRLFDKPIDDSDARQQLRFLRGKTQALYSAVAVYQENQLLWHYVGIARLVMRDFSDAFMDVYLQTLGDAKTSMVGACPVEGLGLHLLESIAGEYTTILGLPMLPLLKFLREQGVLPV